MLTRSRSSGQGRAELEAPSDGQMTSGPMNRRHPNRSPLLADRLAKYITIDPETGCHLWHGVADEKGYGRLRYRSKPLSAHRVGYELVKGPIPAGLQIDHLCRNPACCNAAHLEAVTPRENVRRGNNPAAVNARKTHCSRGHELSGPNLFTKDGRRICITCRRVKSRLAKAKRKAACLT
jgi:hypothetical protein